MFQSAEIVLSLVHRATAKGTMGRCMYIQNPQTNGPQEKIVPKNRVLNARFGTSVFIAGDMMLVGALRDDQDRYYYSGSGTVYVYTRYGNTWQLTQKLKPQADDSKSKFGMALAYRDDGNAIAVGAPESRTERDNGGAVYIFTRTGENHMPWELQEVITSEEVERGDEFGASIDFEGLNLFVGAYGRDIEERNAGAIYLYNARVGPCVKKIEEVAIPVTPITEMESNTTQSFLEILEEKKDVASSLAKNAASLAELLENSIKSLYDNITKKEERIVIYDENMAHESAQKRAAERRGIIAPGLPKEVIVQIVESISEIPPDPTTDTVRARSAVVRETQSKLGVVVPVTTRDLRLGDVHEDIYRLQTFLNQSGYRVATQGSGSPGNETSTFTPATVRALKSFQLVNGLPVTGILDESARNEILTFVTK